MIEEHLGKDKKSNIYIYIYIYIFAPPRISTIPKKVRFDCF